MPYSAWPPNEFLHFTRSLTSKLLTEQMTSLLTSCHIRHVCWHYKSVCFIVTSVHSVDVAGCPVSLSDHIKILGVTLDSHLSLDKHINSICSVRITWKPEYAGPPHLLRRPPHYSENLGYRGGRRRPPHFCVNEMIMISFNPDHNIHR